MFKSLKSGEGKLFLHIINELLISESVSSREHNGALGLRTAHSEAVGWQCQKAIPDFPLPSPAHTINHKGWTWGLISGKFLVNAK